MKIGSVCGVLAAAIGLYAPVAEGPLSIVLFVVAGMLTIIAAVAFMSHRREPGGDGSAFIRGRVTGSTVDDNQIDGTQYGIVGRIKNSHIRRNYHKR